MKYVGKKPNAEGKPFSDDDMERLERLFRKYGGASFDAACRSVRTLPKRRAGQPSNELNNLFAVYVALHESVSEIGIEKTCKVLEGYVDMPNGTRKYKAGGLKTLYGKALKMIEKDPEMARRAKMFEDLRSGRLEPLQTIGDPIPKFPSGPIIPGLARRK
jgi:hypothetical protein